MRNRSTQGQILCNVAVVWEENLVWRENYMKKKLSLMMMMTTKLHGLWHVLLASNKLTLSIQSVSTKLDQDHLSTNYHIHTERIINWSLATTWCFEWSSDTGKVKVGGAQQRGRGLELRMMHGIFRIFSLQLSFIRIHALNYSNDVKDNVQWIEKPMFRRIYCIIYWPH